MDNVVIYTNDHLGTPQKLTAVNGAVAWSAKYSSFGQADVALSSTITNNLRFPGQYYDQETALVYNRFRYYDSMSGRYLTSDPIGFAGGINIYSYVLNNPVNDFDELGLEAALKLNPNPTPTPTPPSAKPPLRIIPGGGAKPKPSFKFWRIFSPRSVFLMIMAPVPVGEGSDQLPDGQIDPNDRRWRKKGKGGWSSFDVMLRRWKIVKDVLQQWEAKDMAVHSLSPLLMHRWMQTQIWAIKVTEIAMYGIASRLHALRTDEDARAPKAGGNSNV